MADGDSHVVLLNHSLLGSLALSLMGMTSRRTLVSLVVNQRQLVILCWEQLVRMWQCFVRGYAISENGVVASLPRPSLAM